MPANMVFTRPCCATWLPHRCPPILDAGMAWRWMAGAASEARTQISGPAEVPEGPAGAWSTPRRQ